MPTNLGIAAFVLGGVLLLIAVVGGKFKIFGAEISGQAETKARIFSGIVGMVLVFGTVASSKNEPPVAPADPPRMAPQPSGGDKTDNPPPRGSPEPAANRSYPAWVVQNFMNACLSSGGSQPQCSCMLQSLETRYTAEEFAMMDTQMRMGTLSAADQQYFAKVKLECGGQ